MSGSKWCEQVEYLSWWKAKELAEYETLMPASADRLQPPPTPAFLASKVPFTCEQHAKPLLCQRKQLKAGSPP